jgi:nucleotide-binding universal stress UspA family protein
MKTILVPTDFSDGAYKAAEYAINFAKDFGGKIIICHAFELPAQGVNLMIDISSELEKNAKVELQKLDKKLKKEYLLDGEVEVEYIALIGDLNAVLKTLTEQYDAELVIMGTKGESDFASKLFGTNTVSAIKNCKISLLVVPAKADYKPIKNIAFAIDYLRPANDKTLKQLRDIALHNKAKLSLVNVHTDGEIGEFIASVKEMQNWYQKELEGVDLDFVFIENYAIEDGVFEFIHHNDIDLLAMITRKHSFFDEIFRKSISEELALHTNIPLLTMHEEKKNKA